MIEFSPYFPYIQRKSIQEAVARDSRQEPLREFVYLDEVSLASLLASQKGELTENITAQYDEARQIEIGGKLSSNVPMIPAAELTSRFQTTNSNSLQTVRKSSAQSLFRELHKIDGIRKIEVRHNICSSRSLEEIIDARDHSIVTISDDLRRGDLVELRVKLSASWIFQISTMLAEFSDMFDESPGMFIDHVKFGDLYQANSANKVIGKLLAGLIPIDGMALDYSVLEKNGTEYIVHNSSISHIDCELMPLQIVGVTDHLAYWKDIRRILFAKNEFTILCRVSKSGLQREWNPIKLADIFKEFAPDLANQIESSSRTAFLKSSQSGADEKIEPIVVRTKIGLVKYKEDLINNINFEISNDQSQEINLSIAEMLIDYGTAEGQRLAFAQVRSHIEALSGTRVDSDVDLEIRNNIRASMNLPLFPSSHKESTISQVSEVSPEESRANRLLDVEVVAIYW